MKLALIGNTILRAAIQLNLVSFPSQIPAFVKRRDAQVRIVQLYFVRRWTVRAICERYGLSKATVQKSLTEWRIRAVSAGYIQEIHPKVLAMFAIEEDVSLQEIFEASEPDCDIAPSQAEWEWTLPPRPDQVVSAAAPR
jgi:DNA-binding transcriptional regulator LsrR (DeoR family)